MTDNNNITESDDEQAEVVEIHDEVVEPDSPVEELREEIKEAEEDGSISKEDGKKILNLLEDITHLLGKSADKVDIAEEPKASYGNKRFFK